MVGNPAAVGLEVFDAVGQGPAHILHGVDGIAHHVLELRHILREGGLIRPHGLVRPEGRQDHRRGGGVGGQKLMGLQIVHGIVGGADQLDAVFADDAPDGHIGLMKDGVALLVNLHGVVAGEGLMDAEVALQLQMGPVIEGVADEVRYGLAPLLELFRGGGVAGDVLFRHTAGAHGPPLVVVAAQPDLGDGVVALVLIDLHGVDVAVVVDNGHLLRVVVVEGAGGLGPQQEVFVHKRFHGIPPDFNYFLPSGPASRFSGAPGWPPARQARRC